MTTPAWHNDILAVYPYFLDELRKIPEISAVLEAKDLEAISGDEPEEVPFDKAVYVVLDSFTPSNAIDRNKASMMTIGFSVILVMEQYTPCPQIDGVGAILTRICKKLQGFDPRDEQDRALIATPFQQVSALSIRYDNGFAYFPLRFTADVAVMAG